MMHNSIINSPTAGRDLHLGHRNTTKHTLEYFVPEDDETNDTAVHKQIGEQIKEPINTEGDKSFSREENAS